MRSLSSSRWCALVLVTLAALPATAAERVAETMPAASAPTTRGAPVLTSSVLSDLLPSGSLLYIGWPGINALSKTSKDTELAKLLKEPEVQRFRTAWWKKTWPAIEEQIVAEIGDESKQELFKAGKEFASAVWHHPVAISLIGVSLGGKGPQVDAAVIVRAGKDAGQLAKLFESVLTNAKLLSGEAGEFTKGEVTLKMIKDEHVPLMWGTVGTNFVIAAGTRAAEYLAEGTLDQSLTQSERFGAAMKATGGSLGAPVVFLDIRGAIAALKTFQPMFAGMNIPVLGDAQAFNATLEKLGLDAVESLSAAMVPEARGFKSIMFLHLPGAAASKNPWINRKALVSDDIAVVPRNADWASVVNCDLAASYSSVLGMVRSLSPTADETVSSGIAEIEKRIGVSIGKDLLGAFEGNFAVFDSPDNGGFWLSGTVLVAKVKRDNQLGKVIRNIMEVIAEEIGRGTRVVMGKEEYRGQKIEYVTLSGIPLPVAPAWAEFQGRWVFALFPQMVRTELDHLMNRAPSLLDNPDFQRGRQLLPTGAFAVTYVDTRVGFRQIYSFALPIAQMGAAMLHKEDIPFDVGMLPCWQVINRHLFGNVSASVVNDQGVLTVSHGALPVAIPAIGEGGMAIPLMVGIMLPSLSRARELSKRTVSAANLKGIGTAMYTYAVEHEDKFPESLQVLVDNGSISPKTLRSPLDESDAASSYIYITGQTAEMDQRNVLVYENLDNYDGEGTTVLFVDSHAEFVTAERFQKMLQDTYRQLGREVPETPQNKTEGTEKTSTEESSGPADAKTKATRAAVGRNGSLAAAIELFKNAVGRYPKELKELIERPEEESAAEKWFGPYVKDADSLKDSWGRPLEYLAPGKHDKSHYDLWSVGPDGQDGTDDDIANWKK